MQAPCRQQWLGTTCLTEAAFGNGGAEHTAMLAEPHAFRASHLSKLHQVRNLGLVVGVTNSAPDLVALAQQLTDKLCCDEACSVAPNMCVGA